MYVCLCNGFTDKQVRVAGGMPGCSVAAVYRSLGVQPRCGKCVPTIRDILQECGVTRRDDISGDAFAPA